MNSSNASTLTDSVIELSRLLLQRGMRIATVESCTGGGAAARFTELPGSSRWFDRGFVTYSNQAKVEMVGVREQTLSSHGAVSEAVALEMALGGVEYSEADCALSITGVAGPDGGSEDKPVGMVCFGWAGFGAQPRTETRYFEGDRQSVRRQSIRHAIGMAITLME